MTTTEIITICFTSIALVVSFFIVYCIFLRKKLFIVGCLATDNSPFNEHIMIFNYGFSLTNNSIRESLVKEAMVGYMDAPDHFLSPMIIRN